MSIAEKLTQIAENEQKVYDAGYAKGNGIEIALSHGYVHVGHCACPAGNCIGKPISEWAIPNQDYNLYGFALPQILKGKQIKFTGVALANEVGLVPSSQCIVFVKGFTSEGGGVGVVPHDKIEVTPVDNLTRDPTVEYTLTIPNVDIDGMYLSCSKGGVPVVTPYTIPYYDLGYDEGYDEGYGKGYEKGKSEGIEYEELLTPYMVWEEACANGFGAKPDQLVFDLNGGFYADNPKYTTYFYAIGDLTSKLTLTGVRLGNNVDLGTTRENVVFIKNTLTKDAIGMPLCEYVMTSHDVVVTPDPWVDVNPPKEYIIEVPQGLDIDGVMLSCISGGTPVLTSVTSYAYNEAYDKGFEDGKAEGGGSDSGEIVGAYNSSTFTCLLYMTNLPYEQGDTAHDMVSDEGHYISSFYGTVQPGDKYKIIFTRIDGYDYWQTFLFGVGNYVGLIEPATNENVLKHINIIDDNTYEITIPDGCYWFNVNFYNPMPCIIYKLN